MNNDDDGYALARPPRRTTPGCPLCGADVEPTKGERWPQHSPPDEPKGTKCDLSGLGTYYPTDGYFRTFVGRDSPEGWPEEGHRITTVLENYGDAIGFANALEIPTSHATDGAASRVTTLITKADYPRLRDELDRMAQALGWLDEDDGDVDVQSLLASDAANLAKQVEDADLKGLLKRVFDTVDETRKGEGST